METIKHHLSKWFTEKELKSLEIKTSICPLCNKNSGNLIKLIECKNKIIMCFQCLEMYNDSCDKKYMFNCPCCDTEINDFIIIN